MLASLYLPHRPGEDPAHRAERAALESALRTYLTTASAAWDAFSVSAEVFVPYAAARRPVRPLSEALAVEHAGELYLACGVTASLPAALVAFETRYVQKVPLLIQGVVSNRDERSEIASLVRERLIGPGPGGAAPRIAGYCGSGPLLGWVRVTALRVALNQRRDHPRHQPLPELVAGPLDDPELDYVRARYQPEFTAALAAALADLSAEERNLLRQRFLEGVGSSRLAAALRVHRSHVARLLVQVRQKVFRGTKERLRARLGIDTAEFESLLRVLDADLDTSLVALLSDQGP